MKTKMTSFKKAVQFILICIILLLAACNMTNQKENKSSDVDPAFATIAEIQDLFRRVSSLQNSGLGPGGTDKWEFRFNISFEWYF